MTVKVQAGTQPGKTVRVRGRGIEPAKGEPGDLLVTFDVEVPKHLTDEQRQAVEALAGAFAREPACGIWASDRFREVSDVANQEQTDRALYIISVAAELAGVHPQTLRIYERKGLIEPPRTEGGSRRYSERDIALLRRIQELTNEGVSLVGVRKILELEDQLARAEARRARARPRRSTDGQASRASRDGASREVAPRRTAATLVPLPPGRRPAGAAAREILRGAGNARS